MAKEHFDFYSVEIDNPDARNKLIGIMYRSHTFIDHFLNEIYAIFGKQQIQMKERNIIQRVSQKKNCNGNEGEKLQW